MFLQIWRQVILFLGISWHWDTMHCVLPIFFYLIIQRGNDTALASGLGKKRSTQTWEGQRQVWCFCTGFLILGARSAGFDFQTTIYPGFLLYSLTMQCKYGLGGAIVFGHGKRMRRNGEKRNNRGDFECTGLCGVMLC